MYFKDFSQNLALFFSAYNFFSSKITLCARIFYMAGLFQILVLMTYNVLMNLTSTGATNTYDTI